MDLELTGKVAVVTGAAGGIGAATARRFLAEGARVVALDREAGLLAATVEELAAHGEIVGHVADLATPDFGPPLVDAATVAFGGVDVVVNNAAIYPSRRWDEYSVEEFDAVLAINLRALWLMGRATVPVMAGRGGGAIVNIGSITFAIGMERLLPYIASKGGVVGVTRALAREVGRDNVRVNTVSPGAFPSGGETIHPDQEGYNRFVIEQQALKRRGTLDELADAVVYLASARASFITGQTLQVCGGWAHT